MGGSYAVIRRSLAWREFDIFAAALISMACTLFHERLRFAHSFGLVRANSRRPRIFSILQYKWKSPCSIHGDTIAMSSSRRC